MSTSALAASSPVSQKVREITIAFVVARTLVRRYKHLNAGCVIYSQLHEVGCSAVLLYA